MHKMLMEIPGNDMTDKLMSISSINLAKRKDCYNVAISNEQDCYKEDKDNLFQFDQQFEIQPEKNSENMSDTELQNIDERANYKEKIVDWPDKEGKLFGYSSKDICKEQFTKMNGSCSNPEPLNTEESKESCDIDNLKRRPKHTIPTNKDSDLFLDSLEMEHKNVDINSSNFSHCMTRTGQHKVSVRQHYYDRWARPSRCRYVSRQKMTNKSTEKSTMGSCIQKCREIQKKQKRDKFNQFPRSKAKGETKPEIKWETESVTMAQKINEKPENSTLLSTNRDCKSDRAQNIKMIKITDDLENITPSECNFKEETKSKNFSSIFRPPTRSLLLPFTFDLKHDQSSPSPSGRQSPFRSLGTVTHERLSSSAKSIPNLLDDKASWTLRPCSPCFLEKDFAECDQFLTKARTSDMNKKGNPNNIQFLSPPTIIGRQVPSLSDTSLNKDGYNKRKKLGQFSNKLKGRSCNCLMSHNKSFLANSSKTSNKNISSHGACHSLSGIFSVFGVTSNNKKNSVEVEGKGEEMKVNDVKLSQDIFENGYRLSFKRQAQFHGNQLSVGNCDLIVNGDSVDIDHSLARKDQSVKL